MNIEPPASFWTAAVLFGIACSSAAVTTLDYLFFLMQRVRPTGNGLLLRAAQVFFITSALLALLAWAISDYAAVAAGAAGMICLVPSGLCTLWGVAALRGKVSRELEAGAYLRQNGLIA